MKVYGPKDVAFDLEPAWLRAQNPPSSFELLTSQTGGAVGVKIAHATILVVRAPAQEDALRAENRGVLLELTPECFDRLVLSMFPNYGKVPEVRV